LVGNKCRCALVGAEAAAVLAASPAKVTFGGGPFAVFKECTTRYRVCLAGSKRATNTINPQGRGSSLFPPQGTLGLQPKACTVSWRRYVVSSFKEGERLPGRRSCAARAAVVLDWYTSCSSLNLPSSKYAGCALVFASDPLLAGISVLCH
jgi:hypothetical protein